VEASYGGTVILGEEADGAVGTALSVSGDVEADGLADVLLLQTTDTSTSPSGDGLVFLFLGSSLTDPAVGTGSAGVVMSSTSSSGPLSGVRWLGDSDGDGTADLVVSATSATVEGVNTGAVYMVTGDELGISAGSTGSMISNLSLDDLATTVWGSGDEGEFGGAVTWVPDVDGDGIGELAVGDAGTGHGTVYVWFSGSMVSGHLSAQDADAAFSGPDVDDGAGTALVGMDDLDGDGIGELAVGAPGGSAGTGVVFVVSGSEIVDDLDLEGGWITLTGDNEGDAAGSALATGDSDGDGLSDLVVGAPNQDTRAGRVHVVAGMDLAEGSWNLADVVTVSWTGTTVFGGAGSAVATGDVDLDGLDDLLLGGPGDSSGGGDAGVAHMVISGLTGSRALANADSTFFGGSEEDSVGTSLDLGDVDGDGRHDMVLGVPGEDGLLGNEGAVYIGFSTYP
jgi:hypothetical protein